MSNEKDVIIKIGNIKSPDLLEEFLENANKIGLVPSEIRQKALPSKPDRKAGNSTKDVMITVSGDPKITDQIIAELSIRVKDELNLLPSSENEKILGEKK